MYEYEKLLQEEGKSVSDLPKEIKAKLTGLKLLIGKVAKNPSLQANITKQDLLIADMIQTWIENSVPKETAEQKATREKNESDAKLKADAEIKELADKNKITQIQNDIVTKMNASRDRSIERNDLVNILGRPVSDKETVGSLRLYKAYLTTRYKAM